MLVTLCVLLVLGLAMGSFASVLAVRLPKQTNWRFTRSACSHCKRFLRVADLVPLVSFALLQGKCRYCRKRISWRYPALELGMGALFVAAGYWLWPAIMHDRWMGLATLVWVLFLTFIAVTLTVTDLEHSLLPDQLVLSGIVTTLAYKVGMVSWGIGRAKQGLSSDASGFGTALLQTGYLGNQLNAELALIAWAVVGAFVLALFFYLLIVVTRGRGMGLGDVKLVFLVGLVAGWPHAVVGVFVAFVTGALVAVALVGARIRSFGQTIPFGPFLLLGGAVSLVAGKEILAFIGY